MGVEKIVNGEAFMGFFQNLLRDKAASSGGANLGTITLDVKDSRLERAEAGIGRAEQMNKDFALRPGGGMAGGWDRPEDYPERDLGPMGSSRWQSLQAGGGIHTMRNVGSFYQRWGGTLGDQDREQASMWAAITASPAGRRVENSYSGIEQGGKKMADLLKEYEAAGQGTPAALRATEQMIKLQEAIEALGKAAKEGAQEIGGERGKLLEGEIDHVSGLALAGKLPGGSAAGGGLKGSIGDFMRLANGDVTGAAQSIFGQSMLKKLNAALQANSILGEGGAMEAIGAGGVGVAGLAALYGGFKLGWGIQSSSAEAGVRDAGKALGDYQLSNSLGSGFDLRGLTYTKDRMMLDPDGFAHQRNINMAAARRVLGGMHIGAGGWDGGGGGLIGTADSIYRHSLDMGVDDGALSGFVGQSIRSGETGRGGSAVEGRLDRIAGLIAEGNKYGLSSTETLGVLASMRQSEMARSGFITQGGMQFVENTGRALNASGSEALKGQGGQSFMEGLMNNKNPTFGALTVMGLLGPDGKLNPTGEQLLKEFFDGNNVPEDQRAEIRRNTPDSYLAQALANEGPTKLRMSQQFMKAHPGAAPWAMDAMLGQGAPNLKNVLGRSVLQRGGPDALGHLRRTNEAPQAARDEAGQYEQVAALGMMTQEVKETTRALEAMKDFIEANFTLEQVKKRLQGEAWNIVDHPVVAPFAAATSNRGGRKYDPIITSKD